MVITSWGIDFTNCSISFLFSAGYLALFTVLALFSGVGNVRLNLKFPSIFINICLLIILLSNIVIEYFYYDRIRNFMPYAISFLCYFVGIISIITLGDRFFLKNRFAALIFCYFPVIIQGLVSSYSLLELFIYYELLLLPSVYLVYKIGYTRRAYKANLYFFIWTQIGSLISLFGVAYIVAVVGSTEYVVLYNYTFTRTESTLLFYTFFVGFGIKVPIWPFHYWLTKVHVESPSGFSIFLSGFLVKTALFCFCTVVQCIHYTSVPVLALCIALLGCMDASLKMWGQVDIKKLIAYATIQEMNMILFLCLLLDAKNMRIVVAFLVAHGVLSALMFYIVECVYKRTQSRSIYEVSGLSILYPNLALAIWCMLVIFLGLPTTVKFTVEFCFLLALLEFNKFFGFVIIFVIIVFGSLGFARCWFSLLYGNPGYPAPKLDLTREECYLIMTMISSIVLAAVII